MIEPRALGSGIAVLLTLSLALARPVEAGDSPRVDYDRAVRPILSDTCFTCHGPDPARRKADLRLDTREGFLGAEVGKGVVVPGKPDESELAARIDSNDPDEVMPPPDSGKKLTAAQRATLRAWIEQGADWKGHWAYRTPERPPIPDGSEPNPIDRFLRASQSRIGLEPAPEADRVTLIRRLSFDLRGLPPSAEEAAAFVADARPDFVEKWVDRFMASPQFGERMAMHWLDLVRYSDTNGYHSDNHRDVHLYRDYVIDAFNENLPFDRFTMEQIAGDLLPDADDRTRIASGYNRLLLTTEEGGGQAKEYLAKYAADRVRNVGTVWLGGTFGCAECHDHKYDPYTTRDFYAFGAFFADLQETAVGKQVPTPMPGPEAKREIAVLDARIAELKQTLETSTPALETAREAWERGISTRPKGHAWRPIVPVSAVSKQGATLRIESDGTVLARGSSPERDSHVIEWKTDQAINGLRIDVAPDPELPNRGPGRADNGNFVLTSTLVEANGRSVPLVRATATHEQASWPAAGAIDDRPATGWAILPKTGEANHLVIELGEPIAAGGTIRLTLRFQHGTKHTLGRWRAAATSDSRPLEVDGAGGPPPAIAAILSVEPDKRSEIQRTELAKYHRSVAPELEPTRRALADATTRRKSLIDSAPTMLISISAAPRMMRVLPRGNWLDESGEVVEPAVPSFLARGDKPSGRLTRLDLARWLTSPEHPLVARVTVNRLWKIAFGQGLVATLDDFGSQGTMPAHPELLDRLAVDFRESGWDVKTTLRRMFISKSYRASSVPTESQKRLDPGNIHLSRQNRYRLDAEMIRDAALEVSGLLVDRIGGASAKPYQPAGYWAMMNFPKREWQADKGDGLYRRGLYTYWCRTFLHPSLLAFDASTREECRVERARSNTPLQALVLLNDPSYVEAARAFGERIVRQGGGDSETRLAFAFRTALSRDPRTREVEVLRKLLVAHRLEYEKDRAAASDLISVGERPAPSDLDPAELASWTSVARVILNLHETISRN
ncbi:MAG: PSD1 and planctomycete cytochrome C domain-containing protein [Isosphaeraceae bacterium]|nr:PSD1 and planctomycete cytochrome C domain-containing protein [Isosphaeraceae bacterium]